MPLHSRDVLKLLKAGFTIIRADNENLKIKCKAKDNVNWTNIRRDFKSKAELRREMDVMLKMSSIIED